MAFDNTPLAVRGSRMAAAVLFTFSLMLMSDSMSAQVDRTKQPAADPPPTVAFPHYERFTLHNGLKVFLIHDDRPLVTFRLVVRGGNGADEDLPGLADAVAAEMLKGTKNRSALQFDSEIDFVGGNIDASAAPDFISVSAGGLRKHLPKILDLFSEAIKYPTFPTVELEKYRSEQITSLKSSKAESGFLATYGVNKVLYGDSPYGQMPNEGGLKKLTPERLRAFHAAHFVPSNATLAVVGNFTKEELSTQLESAFGDWTSTAPTAAITPPVFPQQKGRRIILIDRPTAVQSAIRIVGKGPLLNDPDRPRAYVLNSIFGAGTGLGNRLAMNLRETHGYTYTPFSGFDANSYKGHFIAGADVRNEVTDSALSEMYHEIDRMQSEPVPQDELGRNIQSAVGVYLMSIADPATTAFRVQSIDFYGLPDDYYDKLAGVYASVSQSDVQSLSKKYLNNDDLTVVIVGKASEVKPKLERFGKVELWNTDLVPMTLGDPSTGSADVKVTAQQAWDNMLTAMGGKKKLRAVKSLKTTATLEGNIGPRAIKGSVSKTEMAPNKVSQVYDLGVMKQEMYSDGKVVRRGGGGQLETLPADQRDKTLEDSHILSEAYIDDLKAKLNMVGWRDLEGKRALAIEVVYPKNGSVIYFLNPDTWLPYAQESDEGARLTFEDWHDEGGIMLAHKIHMEPAAGVSLVINNLVYSVNPTVDPAIFKGPK